ncbi:class C beta-lactamase, partial [Enterobacter roggenkampii]
MKTKSQSCHLMLSVASAAFAAPMSEKQLPQQEHRTVTPLM